MRRIRTMRRHHHPRHREPLLDLLRQTAPRSAGRMTATLTATVQVDDHRPASIFGSLAGNPQEIAQARAPGVHDPLTFQLDFATGSDASAASQEIIINRRLVSDQFPGAFPPSPALRATPMPRAGTPIGPRHRTGVRPGVPETVVRFDRPDLDHWLLSSRKVKHSLSASGTPNGLPLRFRTTHHSQDLGHLAYMVQTPSQR